MRTENLIAATTLRAKDIQMSTLPYVAIHAVVLLSIVFGGSGLEADGVKLALEAFAVFGSVWITVGVDGAIADIGLWRRTGMRRWRPATWVRTGQRRPSGWFVSSDLFLPCWCSLPN